MNDLGGAEPAVQSAALIEAAKLLAYQGDTEQWRKLKEVRSLVAQVTFANALVH